MLPIYNRIKMKKKMTIHFFTDTEYEDAFVSFGGIRNKIASLMRETSKVDSGVILDIPAGHGYLSLEIAKKFPDCTVIGIGLPTDVESFLHTRPAENHSSAQWVNVEYLACDATKLSLRSKSCEAVVNFLGLEDINMTRGPEGVKTALSEMERVTKKNGLIQISFVEYGDSPEERLAEEIWNRIGLGCVFWPRNDYVQYMDTLGLHPMSEEVFEYPRKMTVKQAEEELRFACEMAPKTFSEFHVKAITFSELWNQFGDRIEEHGVAYWPRIRVILFSKR